MITRAAPTMNADAVGGAAAHRAAGVGVDAHAGHHADDDEHDPGEVGPVAPAGVGQRVHHPHGERRRGGRRPCACAWSWRSSWPGDAWKEPGRRASSWLPTGRGPSGGGHSARNGTSAP